MAANGDGRVSMANGGTGRNGLAKIHTEKRAEEVCHDDSTTPMKAQTIDELHSLQMKKSAPTTPLNGIQGAFAAVSEDERNKQQLQSIRYTLTVSRQSQFNAIHLLFIRNWNCILTLIYLNFGAVVSLILLLLIMMGWCIWFSASLASLTRETGPRVVRGDPASKSATPRVVSHDHHHVSPTISVSDSSLKFTHVLYNLSPAGN